MHRNNYVVGIWARIENEISLGTGYLIQAHKRIHYIHHHMHELPLDRIPPQYKHAKRTRCYTSKQGTQRVQTLDVTLID